jgi:hypothetical protein
MREKERKEKHSERMIYDRKETRKQMHQANPNRLPEAIGLQTS